MSVLATLTPYINIGEGALFTIAGVFTRISGIVFLAPGLGERTTPIQVRLAAALAFSIIIAPMVLARTETAPPDASGLLIIILSEAIVGLLFGFALRLFLFLLQIAGSIIAQHVSLSQLFGPNVGHEAESPYTAILLMGGVALALSANLHIHLAAALVETYAVLPFGAFPDAAFVGAWSTERTGAALHTALALSAPFVVLGFIYSLALAASSRAMPQLMAAFVGAPAITLAGLGLFVIGAPVMLSTWLSSLDNALFTLFGTGAP